MIFTAPRCAAAAALALLVLSCVRSAPATPTATQEAAASTSEAPTATPTPLGEGAVAAAEAPAPDVPAAGLPDETRGARVVDRGTSGRRSVALTFDAGADAGYTALILDVLRQERVRASFAVTGQWAEANPELLRRIAREGHMLINHTRDHASFTGRSKRGTALASAARWRELDDCAASILRIAGVDVRPYFRPPYGDYDASVVADAGAHGYDTLVMWSVDSRGWMGLAAPAIIDRVLRLVSPGAIIVFHVGSQSQDGIALGAIIAGLRAGGYAFESVAELLAG